MALTLMAVVILSGTTYMGLLNQGNNSFASSHWTQGRPNVIQAMEPEEYKEHLLWLSLTPEQRLALETEITPLGSAKKQQYIKGYPDVTFKGDEDVSRAELATIFARLLDLNLEVEGDPVLVDINKDYWAYKEIYSVYQVGIFDGIVKERGLLRNSFIPERFVTRDELAKILSNYWDHIGINVSDKSRGIIDIKGRTFEKEINQAYNSGVMNVYDAHNFNPNEILRRDILVKTLNNLVNQPELVRIKPTFKDLDVNDWGYIIVEPVVIESEDN